MLLPVGGHSCSRPALLSLLSATAMLVGCKDEHPVAEARTPVCVQRIARARYESDLGFRVARKIAERLVTVGDRLDKDQPLARLDPTDYRLAVESSRAQVAAARSRLAQAAADEQRYEKLLTDPWVSPAAYEQKKAAADKAHDG